jgi:hypothetical protein
MRKRIAMRSEVYTVWTILLLLVEREEKGAEAGKRSSQIKVACCARPFSSNMWRVVLPAARTKEEEKMMDIHEHKRIVSNRRDPTRHLLT